MDDLRRKFQSVLGKKQTVVKADPGWLGDGNGNVTVASRPNFVYVRVGNQKVVEAYNREVAPIHGLAVLVGFDPPESTLLRVLSARPQARSGEDDTLGSGGVPFHNQQHEWMAEGPAGGDDPVYIHLRQFMPLRVGPGGGLTVAVHRGTAFLGGQWRYVEPTTTTDLSSLVPRTADSVCWVLIYLDADGVVTTLASTPVPSASLTLPMIPPIPENGLALAAVRLYNGQQEIVEARSATDILDCRFPGKVSAGVQEIVVDVTTGEVVIESVSGTVVYSLEGSDG